MLILSTLLEKLGVQRSPCLLIGTVCKDRQIILIDVLNVIKDSTGTGSLHPGYLVALLA